jgi:hypothetical protein
LAIRRLAVIIILLLTGCTYSDGVERATIHGRVVDQQGNPLSRVSIDADLAPDAHQPAPERLPSTGADGSFTISVARGWGGSKLFNLIPLAYSEPVSNDGSYKQVYLLLKRPTDAKMMLLTVPVRTNVPSTQASHHPVLNLGDIFVP